MKGNANVAPRRVTRPRKTPHMLEEEEKKKKLKEESKIKKLSKLSEEEIATRKEEKKKEKEKLTQRLLHIEQQRYNQYEEKKQTPYQTKCSRSLTKFSLFDHLESNCVLDRDYCFDPR